MKAARLIGGAALDPDRAEMLMHVFEEAWQSIAGDYVGDARTIESVRLELATIMLAVSNGTSDVQAVKETAVRLLRDDFGSVRQARVASRGIN